MKRFLFTLGLVLILCLSATAQTTPPEKGQFGLYPILAYTDIGFLAGGYQFYVPSNKRLSWENYLVLDRTGLEVQTTLNRFFLNKHFDLETSLFFTSLPQYYFGLGNETSLSDKKTLHVAQITYRLGLKRKLTDLFSVGCFYDYNTRAENTAKNNNITYVSAEGNSALELALCYDNRSTPQDDVAGTYANLSLFYYPKAANTQTNLDDIVKAELDWRYFLPVFKNTLALRTVLGALSYGRSSYLQQFKIGSSTLMRGVYSNRFIGRSLTSFQAEYRFDLPSLLSASVFAEAGQVGDFLSLNQLHLTKGVGLHFDMPDSPATLRFNLAASEDTTLFYGNYGHAF